ncbi:UDP-3-O-acyl-N-acetylglucosamine deacetylase [Methylobacterium haplocladii]|uniref:UDP-3-O-acyl-N-acetylglucosamine deacetylase n=1 Tax=Methylobacterium haplocladii TaxID=1176176 RepID=A0A512IU97_9HYPH|nr:UDP-3-O-acyl-N-acetylglucosamine deacetylase [Methylobacterium haplocladii]GEP01278.1 UDP-3-O-acyl-N-acetylglucosamine deacetylase [Methylobacterium haplocladii]GJD86127.1 UDP-3-O-acyl-N-acetylglucosamine deacetylase [Methylobacterium haplocladii]GLS60765.1 UDP-3-O-acyl-N-acetylglucosamine deacetylase [Methylobacterium haplocladii]
MAVEQRFETTLAAPFSVSGRGLHTNRLARVSVEPAGPGHRIRFDVEGAGIVALSHENRAPSRLNTALALPSGGTLRTIEHLCASLSAFGIDNALVRLEGRELPILDGSARGWCAGIERAGIARQAAPRRVIRITRPIQVAIGQRFVRAEPADRLELDVTCEAYYAGGVQAWRGYADRTTFVAELASSRSSGQVSRLWRFGPVADRLLAPLLRPLRARSEPAGIQAPNTPRSDLPTVLAQDVRAGMVHPDGEPILRGVRPGRVAIQLGPWVLGGARFPDERVRHNALDLLGDLMLAGHPLVGRIVAHRPTHKLTYALVATLMRSPDAWEFS